MNDPYDVRHAAIASDDGMPEPLQADATPASPSTAPPAPLSPE